MFLTRYQKLLRLLQHSHNIDHLEIQMTRLLLICTLHNMVFTLNYSYWHNMLQQKLLSYIYIYINSLLLHYFWNNFKKFYNSFLRMSVLFIFHLDALKQCKLCNSCNIFKEEMEKFIDCVPLVVQRLFIDSFVVETFHCILHLPGHMWFFHLFKRGPSFFKSLCTICKRMNTSISHQIMEVIVNVANDRRRMSSKMICIST